MKIKPADFAVPIIISAMVASLLLIFGNKSIKRNTNIYKNLSYDLDGIDHVPEWLNVMVDDALPKGDFVVWVPTGDFETSSLVKVPRFPSAYTNSYKMGQGETKISDLSELDTLTFQVFRNEQFSGQLVLGARHDLSGVNVHVDDFESGNNTFMSRENVEIRFVKYVPVQRGRSEFIWSAKYEEVAGPAVSGSKAPDVVADPLVNIQNIDIPSYRAQPVWLTFKIPKDLIPGVYQGKITINTDQIQPKEFILKFRVLDMELHDPVNYTFFMDLWFNPNAVATNHNLKPWSQPHWEMLEKYIKELASGGVKTITTIINHEPWRIHWLNNEMRPQTSSGFETMIKWMYTKEKKWKFDYSIFDKYVQMYINLGIDKRINTYSLTSFRGSERITYFDQNKNETVQQQFNFPGSPEYQKIWSLFLEDFTIHLKEKDWLEKTYLFFDERPEETMGLIAQFIKEKGPQFANRISIAGHPESDLPTRIYYVKYRRGMNKADPQHSTYVDSPLTRILLHIVRQLNQG